MTALHFHGLLHVGDSAADETLFLFVAGSCSIMNCADNGSVVNLSCVCSSVFLLCTPSDTSLAKLKQRARSADLVGRVGSATTANRLPRVTNTWVVAHDLVVTSEAVAFALYHRCHENGTPCTVEVKASSTGSRPIGLLPATQEMRLRVCDTLEACLALTILAGVLDVQAVVGASGRNKAIPTCCAAFGASSPRLPAT